MSVKSLVSDPEFEKLSPEEKQGVLSSVDPDFKGIGINEVESVVNGIKGTYNKIQPTVETLKRLVTENNPMSLVAKAAPSNIGKLMGIAGANAPNLANVVLNGMPGMSQPNQIVPNLQGLASKPKQVLNAIQRVGQVEAGGDLRPIEKTPALIGQAAGTALEIAAQPSMNIENIKASGPFTAGLKNPGTVLPGSFNQAGTELGAAKTVARAGENASDASRLRVMLQKKDGVTKIAEEGKALMEAGKDVPVTNLLAYKQALGEAQARGGTFANDYKIAFDKVNELLLKKAPDLSAKLERMATEFAAKGDAKSFPWFTFALNPTVGAAKAAATLPIVKNVAGAALSPIVNNIPKIASMVNSLVGKKLDREVKNLQNPAIPTTALTLTVEMAKKFLKEAKGDRDKARKIAQDKGYVIPEVGK